MERLSSIPYSLRLSHRRWRFQKEAQSLFVGLNGPEPHDALTSVDGPTHSCGFQPVVYELSASPSITPAGHWIAFGQKDLYTMCFRFRSKYPMTCLRLCRAAFDISCLVSLCFSPPIILPTIPWRSIHSRSVTNSLACGLSS